MLKPRQLDEYPQALVDLYSEVETDIIKNMARRISQMDFIPSAEWQYKKLIEMGLVHDEILKKLSSVSGTSKAQITSLMKEAGVQTIKTDSIAYKKMGLDPPLLRASPDLLAILQTGIENTKGLFENLTHTTASTASHQFERALDKAWLQITTGAFDRSSAIRMAIEDLSNKGIASITYPPTMKNPNGKTVYIDTAVRRAVLTGINQTALKMQDKLADEMDCDLVDVTAHAGARTGRGVGNHAAWQGKRYSRSGRSTKYSSLKEKTGYGTGAGLGGWNCRHSMFPAMDGMDPVYTQEELDDFNAEKYTYNGQNLTEEKAVRIQRGIERSIRKYKREYIGMQSAGLSVEESAAKLAHWRDVQKDFIGQTGLKRQYDRESIVGFGNSEAQKATHINSISSGGHIKNSISQKTTKEAENWAVANLGTKSANYKNTPIETVNEINKSLFEIFEEYPTLKGFLNHISFVDVPDVAQAAISIDVNNKKIITHLNFSSRYVKDLSSIQPLIDKMAKANLWSPKEGLYGIIKHECTHLIEYAYAINKYGINQSAINALKSGELSTEIKKSALSSCNLIDDTSIIKMNLSDYANVSSLEFLAEAVSEHKPRKLAKETVKILKQKLGVK